MILKYFLIKVAQRLKSLLIFFVFQYPRIVKYKILSDCKKIQGKPKFNQPAIIAGKGKVIFGNKFKTGVTQSPFYFNGYDLLTMPGLTIAALLSVEQRKLILAPIQ